MSRNGVVGFNILDDNFSRDVSEMGMSEMGISELGISNLGNRFVEKRIRQRDVKTSINMSMLRSVDGFYGYEARDGPEVPPRVYVKLEFNATLKVTWDEPNFSRYTSSPVNHYFIVLREVESGLSLFIGRTESATREYTIDLASKYYISMLGGLVSDPPTNNIKDNMIYEILISAVDNIQAPRNAQLNNNRIPNIYPEGRRKVGQSYTFKLMKQEGIPTNVSVVGGDSKASVTWTAPPPVATGATQATSNNTIFNIKNKGYNITFKPSFINEYLRKIIVTNDIISNSITADPPTSAEILSLTNSTTYKITVKAISYIGNSLSQGSTEISLNLTGVAPPPRTREVIIEEERLADLEAKRLAAAKEVADRELAIRTTIGTATNLRLTALPDYGHFLIEWDSPFSAHDFTKKVLVKLDLGNITFAWFTDAGSTGDQFRGPEGGTRYKITNSGNYHSIYIILPDAKNATNKTNIVATLQYDGFYYSNTKYTNEKLYGPVLTSNSVSITGLSPGQTSAFAEISRKSYLAPLVPPRILSVSMPNYNPGQNIFDKSLLVYRIDPDVNLKYELIVYDSNGAQINQDDTNKANHTHNDLFARNINHDTKYDIKFYARRIKADGTLGERSDPYTLPICVKGGRIDDLGCSAKPGDTKTGYRRGKMNKFNYLSLTGECLTEDVYTCDYRCPDYVGVNSCDANQAADAAAAAVAASASAAAARDQAARDAAAAAVRDAAAAAARDQAARDAAAAEASRQAARDAAAAEASRQAARDAATAEASRQAARDQAARDAAAEASRQAARDAAAEASRQAARDQAARDAAAAEDSRQAAREQDLRDQAAREQDLRDQALRDQAARDQAVRDKSARDQAAREYEASQYAAREAAKRQNAAAKKGEEVECEEVTGISSSITDNLAEVDCKEVEGFTSSVDAVPEEVKYPRVVENTKPLNLYETLPESSSYPTMSLIITTVILGAIFMALFSSYSPINLKKLKIY